jgi:3-oxoacyl-[acyl-carrier protein] reductase
MNLGLSGKTALVCGTTRGLGYANPMELALLEYNVGLLARNEEKLKTAMASLQKQTTASLADS